MTISASTARLQYVGDGSTIAFAVTFAFYEQSELTVVLTDLSGLDSVQVKDTDYTVTGGVSSGDPATGTVTMLTAPAIGETLTILRNMDFKQETDFPEDGAFPAKAQEQQHDKAVMALQQLREEIDRAIKFKASSTNTNKDFPEAEDGKVIGWSGTDLANFDTELSATAIAALATLTPAADKLPYFTGPSAAALTDLTAAGRSLLDDASVSAMRATLGINIINVKTDYGATGDGSDDSMAVQNALDAMSAGDVLYFPPGVYSVSNLTIPNVFDIRLIGPVKTLRQSSDASGAVLQARSGADYVLASKQYADDATSPNAPITIDGIAFDGNAIADYGLVLYGYNSIIRNCLFYDAVLDGCKYTTKNSAGTSQTGTSVENQFIGNRFRDNTRRGFFIESDNTIGTDWVFRDNFVHGNGGDGIYIETTAGGLISKNHCYSNTGFDLKITSVKSGLRIDGNLFEATNTASFTVNGASEDLKQAINLAGFASGSTAYPILKGNSILGIVWNQNTTAGAILHSVGNVYTSYGTDDAGFLGVFSANNITLCTGDIFAEATPFRANNSAATCTFLCANCYSVNGATEFSGPVVQPWNSLTLPAALPALGALTPASGKIPYFTGAAAAGLLDYEFGDWTPVVTCATPGDLSITYDSGGQVGRYVRIGNLCVYWGRLSFDTNAYTTASGNIQITGAPFTAASNGHPYMGATRYQKLVNISGDHEAVVGIDENTAVFNLFGSDHTNGASKWSVTAMPANVSTYLLDFAGAYEIG